MTPIGTAVFVTMDLSDSFFAVRPSLFSLLTASAWADLLLVLQLAKCINYSEGPTSSGLGSAVAFGWFVIVWS